MLCLTREEEQAVMIIVPASAKPQAVRVQIIQALGKVRLGITADESIGIWREELLDDKGNISPPPPAGSPTRRGESV